MLKTEPTISVVMCVYNGEKYLKTAIESIIGQTYQDFEFIIVDDASVDSSLEIAKHYASVDDRIRLITSKENLGSGKSLQMGIQFARGRFIARMDADDVSLPERLAHQLAYLSAHPEVLVLGGDFSIIDGKGQSKGVFISPKDPQMMRWNMLLGSGWIVCHGLVMIQKVLFDLIGDYGDFRAAQDFELWTRLFSNKPLPIANMDEVLYFYRQHESTTTYSQKDYQEQVAIQVRLKKIEEFLGKSVVEDVITAYRYPTYAYKNIGLCIKTWIEIYQKFIEEFDVNTRTKKEIQQELITRLKKYSYIPPQKTNKKFRVSIWLLISWLPGDMILRFIYSKIRWVIKQI